MAKNWKIGRDRQDQRDKAFHLVDVIEGGVRVAQVAGVGKERAMENARIVVAGPDMLEALKLARFAMSATAQRGFIGGNPTFPDEWLKINAAIAKAEVEGTEP